MFGERWERSGGRDLGGDDARDAVLDECVLIEEEKVDT